MDAASSTSGLISLLGGTFFRLFLGFVMERYKDYQEFKFEEARIRLQDQIETAQNKRHIAVLFAQKELGIHVIEAEKNYESHTLELDAYLKTQASVLEPTGFKLLDAWNSGIRPALATFCIVVWGIYLFQRGWVLGPWDLELIGATLGLFIGSRISNTGK